MPDRGTALVAGKNHNKPDPLKATRDRQQEDRVRRARAGSPPRDERYYLACAELARDAGLEPCEVMDAFDEAAACIQYTTNVSRVDAEALAMEQMLTRYTVQRRLA